MNDITKLSKDDVVKLLPASAKEMAETVSYEVVLKLIEHYGGRELKIPKIFNANHSLTQSLGQTDTQYLISIYGGENIVVPICKSIKKHIRNLNIIQDQKNGLGAAALAKKYHLTTRSIRLIFNKAKNNSINP